MSFSWGRTSFIWFCFESFNIKFIQCQPEPACYYRVVCWCKSRPESMHNKAKMFLFQRIKCCKWGMKLGWLTTEMQTLGYRIRTWISPPPSSSHSFTSSISGQFFFFFYVSSLLIFNDRAKIKVCEKEGIHSQKRILKSRNEMNR